MALILGNPALNYFNQKLAQQAAQAAPIAAPVPQQGGGGVITYGGPAPAQPSLPSSTNSEQLWSQSGLPQVAPGIAEDGGPRGILGAVLGNPIVKGALKPFEALDVPRRYIASAVNEMADAINGGDASFDDFTEQAKDPTFGFGDVVGETGNKWLDRAIGFVGDVALDPLTYLTLGTSKIAGGAGRGAAALRAADAVIPDEVLSKIARIPVEQLDDVSRAAAREAIVSRVGQGGAGVLDDATRQSIGLKRAGLRFGLPNQNVRIPGTGGIERAFGRGAAGVRRGANEVAPGLTRGLRNIRTPLDLQAPAERLATGRGAMSATTAASMFGRDFAEQAAEGSTHGLFGRELGQVLRKNRGEAKGVLQRIEAGERQGLAGKLGELMGRMRIHAVESGVDVGELDNFVPHRWTPEARKFIRSSDPRAVELRSALSIDTSKGVGTAKARTILPDTVMNVRGTAVHFKDATIDEINDKLGRAFADVGVHKWIDDDPVRVLGGYLDDIAENVGRRGGLTRLQELGQVKPFEDVSVERLDIPGTERANTEFERSFGELRNEAFEANRQLRRELVTTGVLVRENLIDGLETVDADALLTAAVKVKPKGQLVEDWERVHADLEAAVTQLGRDPEDQILKRLLTDHARGIDSLRANELTAQSAYKMMAAAKSGDLVRVSMQVVEDGWAEVGEGLLKQGEELYALPEVRQALTYLRTATAEPTKFGKMIDWYSNFFRTYATLSPGFHARNGISATFMNASDGVAFNNMRLGAQLWRAHRVNPEGWLTDLPRGVTSEQADLALRAVYGSGAGGQFEAAELGQRAFGKAGKVTNNKVTRFSKRAGETVEGVVRMGMAIDSIKRGDTLDEAIARITRIHFNYGNLSQLDKQAKRLIPFWTFMSRNMPLQIQQMWMKPRTYSHYQSFVDNFREEDGDVIPRTFSQTGAFNTGLELGDDPLYLAPDLPHIRLQQDLERFIEPERLLEQTTPLLRIPLETHVMDKQLYNGRPFHPGEDRWGYGIRGMVPPVAAFERLFPQDDYYRQKVEQSRASWFGFPVRQLTPQAIEAELKRRQRAMEDELRRQKAQLEQQSQETSTGRYEK